VTREYIKNGTDLFRPQFHDLSSIPNGLENPQGWRMVEFPIINALTAFSYRLTSPITQMDLTLFMRLTSVKFSLGSILVMYFLVKRLVEQSKKPTEYANAPLVSALLMALLPFNIFYSQAILPEVSLVFFTLLASLLFLKYINTKSNGWLVAGIAAAMVALLLKPIALFFWLPILLLALKHHDIRWILQPKHLVAAVAVLLPLGLWRTWIQQFPEGIPANRWLFNGNGIRLRPAWFRWLFADRIGRLMLGFWGLIPFGIGLLGAQGLVQRETGFGLVEKIRGFMQRFKPKDLFAGLAPFSDLDLFMYGGLVGVLAYLTIFATGNVQHDYYQVIIVPYVVLVVAVGIAKLLAMRSFQSIGLAVVSLVFMLAFSWYEVQGFFNVNNPAMVEAGKAVDELVEPDALVIAPYGGDTAFLYQTNRRGWPIGGAIEEKIAAGADYYVTTSLDEEAKNLLLKHENFAQNEDFLIIDLNQNN
jgi:4-amino-4-deoxy-L-arabinose transferase-like glycosyltransferase